MELPEALMSTGKAEIEGSLNAERKFAHIPDGEDGALVWDNGTVLSYYTTFRTDWQPYHPEPTECEACERYRVMKEDINNTTFRTVTQNNLLWLLKQACTCKGED
ncbi:MAG: hypothetical protein V3R78_10000 [Thermodesulfobacteriota bacterium]